jgi:hypothetical protein
MANNVIIFDNLINSKKGKDGYKKISLSPASPTKNLNGKGLMKERTTQNIEERAKVFASSMKANATLYP